MNATTIIMAKDLRERVRDGTLVLFGLVLPLGLAFLFTGVLGGGSDGTGFSAEYAVVDADGGELAQVFTGGVLASLEEEGTARIRELESEQEAVGLVEEGGVDAVFLVPAGFTESVRTGEHASLRVVGDPDSPVAVQVAREVGSAFAAEVAAMRLAQESAEDGGGTWSEPVAERFAALDPPVSLAQETGLPSRELDTATFHSAGLAYFFLFFAVMPSVTGLLRERGTGTLGRVLAAPVSRRAVLAGKALSGTVVGVACLLVLMAASGALLGADWGAPLGAALLAVAAALAAVGVTAAVASFAASTEQASNRLVIVTMVLGLVGGAVIPVTQLGPFSALGYLTPHHWFLYGLAELGGGAPASALGSAAVLLAMAAAAGGLALLRLGRMLHS